MKVALVHKRIGHVGGLETRLKNYMQYFSDRGDTVTVFCYKQDRSIELPKNVEVRRVPVGAMPKPYRAWYFNHKLNRLFRQEEFDFSLALGRTSQQVACLAPGDHLGYLKARNKKGRTPVDLVQINLDKLSFNKSQLIFPCSDLVKANLMELYGVAEDKMETLLPPLDTTRFNRDLASQKAVLRERFGMSTSKKTFVAVSTSHKRKGIPLLLELFEELQDLPIELKIAGRSRRKPLRYKPANVDFIGYVKRPEELFTAADYSIHPAIYEPFGQVISESMACGTPVLLSENTGWSRTLPESYGTVVKGFNKEDWKQAIKSFLEKNLHIPENFSELHSLSLEKHMEKMLLTYSQLA